MLQLVLASLVAHVALVGARITTSLYALSLHASTFTIGILIALFALFPMIFAVPIGRWVDRVGMQRPIRIGTIVMATGCVIPSLVDGLPVLYFSVLLIGSGFLAVHIPVQHAVGAFSTAATRAKHFSWLGMGYSASSFVGPVVAGYLIDHARHGISFAVLTGFVLVSMVMQMSKKLSGLHTQHIEPVKDSSQKGSILELLRNRELLRVYVVGICLASAWDLFMFVMPIHGTRMGLSASSIGLILGAFSAATFTVRLGMQWIARHFSEWQILTASLGFSTLCYLVFPFMTTTLSLLLVTVALGLALGASQPNVLSLLHQNAPPGRAGEAVGVRITIGNASQVVLPLAFGAAGATLGLFPVFWAMGALIAVGVPIAWRKSREKIE